MNKCSGRQKCIIHYDLSELLPFVSHSVRVISLWQCYSPSFHSIRILSVRVTSLRLNPSELFPFVSLPQSYFTLSELFSCFYFVRVISLWQGYFPLSASLPFVSLQQRYFPSFHSIRVISLRQNYFLLCNSECPMTLSDRS